MKFFRSLKLDYILLPLVGILFCLGGWALIAGKATTTTTVDDWGDTVTKVERHGIAKNLPSPSEAWTASKPYILEPVAKRGEMDQGALRFAWLSLKLVIEGYLIALVIGTPFGFALGLSDTLTKAVDPIIQVLRPVSPLAWYPLGLILFSGLKIANPEGITIFGASDAAALFTIAICSMWPTVVNTAVGVRKVPQDYLNVAKVLKLSKLKTLFRILVPSTLPYTFTGFRLSLGVAWLVIVAVEMLTGRAGIGGFVWQAYNAGSYSHIIMCILTIGIIGFILDRLMNFAENRFRTA